MGFPKLPGTERRRTEGSWHGKASVDSPGSIPHDTSSQILYSLLLILVIKTYTSHRRCLKIDSTVFTPSYLVGFQHHKLGTGGNRWKPVSWTMTTFLPFTIFFCTVQTSADKLPISCFLDIANYRNQLTGLVYRLMMSGQDRANLICFYFTTISCNNYPVEIAPKNSVIAML